MNWRLICSGCDRRTFHDTWKLPDGTEMAECRACGDSAPLVARKGNSRKQDPNPDRKQQKLERFRE